ncbi:hypothetical protein, partial [Pseudomonas viridiflava]|uniref:hypothetical protein n=1 Tax=Pseudomonas viridiflava TaxID=33069 RepID=UPI0019D1527D
IGTRICTAHETKRLVQVCRNSLEHTGKRSAKKKRDEQANMTLNWTMSRIARTIGSLHEPIRRSIRLGSEHTSHV